METVRVVYLVGPVVQEKTLTAPRLVVTAPLFGLCVMRRMTTSGGLLSVHTAARAAWTDWYPDSEEMS